MAPMILKRLLIAAALALFGVPCWAIYGVRISDLDKTPAPPNPIRVWGRVVSESPVKISDGQRQIELAAISAKVGDYLTITGDWNGSVLTVAAANLVSSTTVPCEMIWIPAGSFQMGNDGSEAYSSPDERPLHAVYLSGFWIGKYEITRAQYRPFVNRGYSNASYWSADGLAWLAIGYTQPWYWDAVANWSYPPGPFTQTDAHPVVGMTYYEAEAFCRWAGGHLPSEAQWEKAARWTGNHANVYPWGDTWDEQKCNSWTDTAFDGWQTAPIGSYPSNISPYGCRDMAGNVWEWCADWYDSGYYSRPPAGGWTDPINATPYACHICRGGSFGSTAEGNRCSHRWGTSPETHHCALGIRLAR